MEEVSKFWQYIHSLQKESRDTIFYGTVKSVDADNRTCVLQVGEVEYEDVRLYSLVKSDLKGIFLVPKKDSIVLACRIAGSNELLVLMFSEVDQVVATIGDKVEFMMDEKTAEYKNDKIVMTISDNKIEIDADEIVFNGGKLGGMTKIEEVVKKLNALEQEINELKTGITTWIVAPQDGGGALKGSLSKWAGKQMTQTKKTDLENDKVKH